MNRKIIATVLLSVLLNANTALAIDPEENDDGDNRPRQSPVHPIQDFRVLMPGVVPNQASWLSFIFGYFKGLDFIRSQEDEDTLDRIR